MIPVYNQFDYTYHCLESILNYSGDCIYEVIVANDNSNDLTTQIHEAIHGIHVVTNEENKRFLLNCNNAAKYAQGQYILFLNNDTQVQENWLQPLIDVMEHDDSVGMVGSKLVYADGFCRKLEEFYGKMLLHGIMEIVRILTIQNLIMFMKLIIFQELPL